MTEYIEREKLIKKIDDYFSKTDPNGQEQVGVLKCRGIIRAMPPADVAPVKHGKWVGYQTNSFKNSSEGLKRKFYRCSICHTANAICAKYCPNCGAKMDLEDE